MVTDFCDDEQRPDHKTRSRPFLEILKSGSETSDSGLSLDQLFEQANEPFWRNGPFAVWTVFLGTGLKSWCSFFAENEIGRLKTIPENLRSQLEVSRSGETWYEHF